MGFSSADPQQPRRSNLQETKWRERQSAESIRKLQVVVLIPVLSASRLLGTVDFLIDRPGKPDLIRMFGLFGLIELADL
jgi:hypothetical protein